MKEKTYYTGPGLTVSSKKKKKTEKQGIDIATPGLLVYHVIHYTTAARSIRRNTRSTFVISCSNFMFVGSNLVPHKLTERNERFQWTVNLALVVGCFCLN